MSSTLRAVAGLSAVAAIAAAALGAAGSPEESVSPETLAVQANGGWATWWRRDAAPARWNGEGELATSVAWRPGAAGLEWSELRVRGVSEAWSTRLILVRLDPQKVDLSLATAFTRDESWTLADAEGAILALDAGQFRHSLPYGWVVTGGRQVLAPEYAPLAGAVVVDVSGSVRVVAPDSVAAEQERGTAREAFQSYPMLLQDGVVPLPLRESGRGVDIVHRDARLALGTLPDGRVILALTRFDFFGQSLDRLPFGLTTPEMAAVMGSLGCRQALLLDGGISSQLMVRGAEGTLHRWPGMRSVPLGLVGRTKR
jgi:uncharacterized protein YigE (DUF2233 family)